MESAFGVNHGGISKGVPKGVLKLAAQQKHISPRIGAVPTKKMKNIQYAADRLAAHEAGKSVYGIRSASKAGVAKPHFVDETITRGHRARMRSRVALNGGN